MVSVGSHGSDRNSRSVSDGQTRGVCVRHGVVTGSATTRTFQICLQRRSYRCLVTSLWRLLRVKGDGLNIIEQQLTPSRSPVGVDKGGEVRTHLAPLWGSQVSDVEPH